MPQKKQPSGAQHRKRAAAKAAALAAIGLTPEQIKLASALGLGSPARGSAPAALPGQGIPGVTPPPLDLGVGACEAWVAGVTAKAAVTQLEEEQGRALRKAVQTIGKLKDKAGRSEKTIKLLALREGLQLDPAAEQPPSDVVALPCWAFFRACVVAHQVASGDLRGAGTQLDMVATLGFVPCNGAIRAATARLRRASKG